jgi:hypothetical protein
MPGEVSATRWTPCLVQFPRLRDVHPETLPFILLGSGYVLRRLGVEFAAVQ